MKEETYIKEQINLLNDRNLIISEENKEIMKKFLQNNNYYRVTGYLYKYKLPKSENFSEEINLEKLFEIYKFDEALRSLINRLLGNIEISFKTYIAYTLALNYGPLAYKNCNNFYDKEKHSKTIDIIKGVVNQRKNKKRIMHNISKNGDNLPIWVLIDVLSFDNIYHIYDNMLKIDQNEIIDSFLRNKINSKIISKWLNAFALLRNDCAHHERIYDEELPNIDIKTKTLKSSYKQNNNTLFAYLLCSCHLIYNKNIWIEFVNNLELEINKYKFIELDKMGFPINWKEILENEY